MKIEPLKITVRELASGYNDNGEGGVHGWDNLLDIRPEYQREFVYSNKQRNAVIDTVWKRFPLNVMYWAERDDGSFEIIDGQQRTISICQYVTNCYSVKVGNVDMNRIFDNLNDDEKNNILDYELMVYACTGTHTDKLKWYEVINIAGEVLTKQELRNAVYTGSWLSDARRYFSRPGGPAYGLGGPYLSGSAIRQDYLETCIKWISGDQIETYMANHQKDESAEELWDYFRSVVNWIEKIFPNKRTIMKGVDWGGLYNTHGNRTDLDSESIENEIQRLINDDDVTNNKGIYPYILTEDEWHLNIRVFTQAMKQKVYEKQKGICPVCGNKFDIEQMDADHIIPWSKGGKTVEDNCRMISKKCNQRKSAK